MLVHPASLRCAWGLVGLSALLAASGCQGGSATAPTAPAAAAGPLEIRPSVSTFLAGDLATGLSALGVYDFSLDLTEGVLSLEPTRAIAALGDSFTLDLTDAFTTNTFGCAGCLQVTGITRDPVDPVLEVTFRARHPFREALAANRADLHINNVRLVAMVDGSDNFYGGTLTGEAGLMASADGYTTLPANFVAPPTGINATLFPFQVFETGDNLTNPTGNFDAATGWLGVTNAPEGFNVLKMGGSATTTLRFRLDGATNLVQGKLTLLGNYIVSAANKAQRNVPDYYMPEGAMPEAWRVMVTPPTTFTANPISQLDTLLVEVADWQHGATVDPGFPGTDKAALSTASDVASVSVSIPAFSATPFGPVTTPSGGTGSLSSPLTYQLAITKPDTITVGGDYFGLVKVTDSRSSGLAIDKSLNAGTGLSTLPEIATYQVVRIPVAALNNLPTCGGFTVNGQSYTGPLTIPFGFNATLPITLDFDFTNDPDGTIVAVDVDWNYDGSNFIVGGTRTTPGALTAPAPYTAPAAIAIRFTDNQGGQNNPADCTVVIGPVYTPTTTLSAATVYVGPSQLTNQGANGSDVNLGRIQRQICSFGNTVYVLCKYDNTAVTGNTYIARSTDGGNTFVLADNVQIAPGLAAGGTNRFAVVTMDVNADGSALFIAGVGSPTTGSSGSIYFSRINTASFTLDASIRGVQLEGATAFELSEVSFETAMACHPTDPQVVYIGADEGPTGAKNLRAVRVGNAAAAVTPAALVTTRIAGAANGVAYATDGVTAVSIFDPDFFMDPFTNRLHLAAQPGGGTLTNGMVVYRQYNILTDAFVDAAPVVMTDFAEAGQANREPKIGVGSDGRAVLVIRSDGPGGTDKGLIRKAALADPPYHFSVPKRIDPDWDGTIQGNQEKPEVVVDPVTNLIYISSVDYRDIGAGESTTSLPSIWETVYSPELNCLIDGRKLDMPGTADNQDTDRTARVHLMLKGSPTTKRWFYLWQDNSRKNAGLPDLVIRTAQ